MATPDVPFPMPAEPAKPEPFNLARYLTKTTFDLLHNAPNNPTVRGLILAELNLWIPENLVTLADMVTWLQAEIVKLEEKRQKEHEAAMATMGYPQPDNRWQRIDIPLTKPN